MLKDGDALIIQTPKLLEIIGYINEVFPERQRIAIYASPKSLQLKSIEELKEIRNSGVDLIYLGLESGDNEILKKTNKGATVEEIIAGAKKAREAGFKTSVTVIAGLGGKAKTKEHAIKTGEAIGKISPDYLGALCLILLPETEIKYEADRGEFEEISGIEMMDEMKLMIESINVEPGRKILFRSNHISNYLNLQGELPEDKEKLLSEINYALKNQDMIGRMKRKTL